MDELKITNKINNIFKLIDNFKLIPKLDKNIANCVVTCSKFIYNDNYEIYSKNTNSLSVEKKFFLHTMANTKLRTQKFPGIIINLRNFNVNISVFPRRINFLSSEKKKFKYYIIFKFSDYMFENGINNILWNIKRYNEVKVFSLGFAISLDEFIRKNDSNKPDIIQCVKYVHTYMKMNYTVQIFHTGNFIMLGLNEQKLKYVDIVVDEIRKHCYDCRIDDNLKIDKNLNDVIEPINDIIEKNMDKSNNNNNTKNKEKKEIKCDNINSSDDDFIY